MRILITILIFSTYFLGISQEMPVGQWLDHLPFYKGTGVGIAGAKVYGGTETGVIVYDKEDGSIERLTTINGLSEIGIGVLSYNPYNEAIVIGYKSGNIDLIKNQQITNINFIKNSPLTGDKEILHIFFKDQYAYLSTGFGIVVLDTDKEEISDTYIIGTNGSQISINACILNDTSLMALTNGSIYYANFSDNLVDYNSWKKWPLPENRNYTNATFFNNQLFLLSSENDTDSVFYLNNGILNPFPNLNEPFVRTIGTLNNQLFIAYNYGLKFYNNSFQETEVFYTYNNLASPQIIGALIDSEGKYWLSDNESGLVGLTSNWDATIVKPNSPSKSTIKTMDIVDGKIATVPGGYGSVDENLFNVEGIQYSSDYEWTTFNQNGIDTLTDLTDVAISPSNTKVLYVGNWKNGVAKISEGKILHLYTHNNSIIPSFYSEAFKQDISRIGSIVFDENENLWITNSNNSNCLTVKTPDDKWYNMNCSGVTEETTVKDLIIDQNGYKWVEIKLSNKSNKILVYDDKGTISDLSDDRSIILEDENLSGGSQIYCLMNDLNGDIWIGTNEGIAVFYSPSEVFTGNLTAEQIFIEQDGQTQILLETEAISAIAVDGANRKWIGTLNAGVFLMSADGTKELLHFTKENSPLFSNTINDIKIDGINGQVYIATSKGLIAYKGTATESSESFSTVYVYPNPVKPEFEGEIAIRGLMESSEIKITDFNGNLIYQTVALGGQAIWNGKDFNGKRAQTGVYLIFASNPDGSQSVVSKILFIN